MNKKPSQRQKKDVVVQTPVASVFFDGSHSYEFDCIASPILCIDPKTANIVDVNTAACKFYGYAREDFIQKKIMDLAAIPVGEVWDRIHKINAGEITHMTLAHRLANGEIRDVAVDLSVAWIKEKSVNVATIFDITEQEQAKQKLLESNLALEKALRAKDEFMAAMSHELRTPIHGIMTTAEVLQMTTAEILNEKQRLQLSIIERSGRRLLDTVNDILEFTQIQAGTYHFEYTLCALKELSQVALQKIAPMAAARNQIAQGSVKPEDLYIQTDPICLHKVLFQLLKNASKFTQTGGEFGIEIIAQEDMKQVNITVWDTGIGIAEENLPHLFNPFAQLDARLARAYEGTGLGLALVKGFTDLIGGAVTVQSTLGKGSRFTVTLPWNGEGDRRTVPLNSRGRKPSIYPK